MTGLRKKLSKTESFPGLAVAGPSALDTDRAVMKVSDTRKHITRSIDLQLKVVSKQLLQEKTRTLCWCRYGGSAGLCPVDTGKLLQKQFGDAFMRPKTSCEYEVNSTPFMDENQTPVTKLTPVQTNCDWVTRVHHARDLLPGEELVDATIVRDGGAAAFDVGGGRPRPEDRYDLADFSNRPRPEDRYDLADFFRLRV